jgi:hypothetical protein
VRKVGSISFVLVLFGRCGLFDLILLLALEVLASNQVWDVVLIIIITLLTLLLLHGLVALGQFAQGRQRVWAELVEDAWDKLGELLVLAVSVDGEGVGWYSCVN